jgi:hypothetical protein
MYELTDISSYVILFVFVAIFGLLGGLAAELLLNRNGETGAFELPRRSPGFIDIGGFATLLVGVVTALAILLVFPPAQISVTTADGSTTLSNGYDIVRLAGTALVAGSAGGSVLTALQARLTAAVAQAEVVLKEQEAERQIEGVARVATERLASAPRPTSRGGGTRSAAPDDAAGTESAIEAVNARADEAKRAIRATRIDRR